MKAVVDRLQAERLDLHLGQRQDCQPTQQRRELARRLDRQLIAFGPCLITSWPANSAGGAGSGPVSVA